MSGALTVVDGAAAGGWIAPRLEGGFGGRVKQQVPNCYDAYVRLFHPALDRNGNLVRWGDVAKALGRTAHRKMQWHKLVGSDDPSTTTGSGWQGISPATGELDSASLDSLCGVLGVHTADPSRCFFGLSTIFAGVGEAYVGAEPLRVPGREYVVFSGPLSAVGEIGSESKGEEEVLAGVGAAGPPVFDAVDKWIQAPNLIWPSDHSWYVTSEYDFDSTLVGGSRELIDALMAASWLETWEVERDDSLESDADDIN